MRRPFFSLNACSVEGVNALEWPGERLRALATPPDALGEYVLRDYPVLYVVQGPLIHLLAIRHQRQLAFRLSASG